MNAWWQMWSGYYDPDWCQGIISRALPLEPERGSIGFGKKNNQDESYRLSKVRWLHRPAWDGLAHQIERMVRLANNNAFGFNLNLLRDIQFTEYLGSEEGHYDWHEDLNWTDSSPNHRKLSVVVQLTEPEEYEEGDLELKFDPPETAALRRRGTIIVFPSFCPHRVTTVTKGTRYSLVAWYEGPKFR